MVRKVALEIICFLIVVLFLYAGGSKLFEFKSFSDQLKLSPVLGIVAPYVALVVPIVEILVVALLISPRFRFVGLFVSFLLMLTFTIYVLAILSFSKELPCSCGGVLQTMNWREHLVFNIIFLILAFGGVLLTPREERTIDLRKKLI